MGRGCLLSGGMGENGRIVDVKSEIPRFDRSVDNCSKIFCNEFFQSREIFL